MKPKPYDGSERLDPADLRGEEAFDRFYPAIFRYFRYRGADVDTANDLASTVSSVPWKTCAASTRGAP